MSTYESMISRLAQPARRALANAGIDTPNKLSAVTETELLGLHGIGPNALSTIKAYMAENRIGFKP